MTCMAPPGPPAAADSLRHRVRVRPLVAGDTDTLLTVFDGMGPRSRERRFLAPVPRLTTSALRHLSSVDDVDHIALVVEACPGGPIGIGRFVRDRSRTDTAEVALAVVDVWQDRGIGTLLVARLVEAAHRVGVRRLLFVMRPDNEPARRVMARVPGRVERLSEDRDAVEFLVTMPMRTARVPAQARP
jgi:RimJ/RimL family protein N-acetyltransferase